MRIQQTKSDPEVSLILRESELRKLRMILTADHSGPKAVAILTGLKFESVQKFWQQLAVLISKAGYDAKWEEE